MGQFIQKIKKFLQEQQEKLKPDQGLDVQRLVLNKRLFVRYTPSSNYPLSIHLELLAKKGMHIPCQLNNISIDGMMITLPQVTPLIPGEKCKVVLHNNSHHLELLAEIKHQKSEKSYGLRLTFQDHPSVDRFIALFAPISIGQSLREISPYHVKQDDNSKRKRIFMGDLEAMMIVWMDGENPALVEFVEFTIENRLMKYLPQKKELQFFHLSENQEVHVNIHATPILEEHLDQDEEAEAKKLFSGIVSNLPPDFPHDVAKLLQELQKEFFID